MAQTREPPNQAHALLRPCQGDLAPSEREAFCQRKGGHSGAISSYNWAPRVGEVLRCALVLMAEFLQSQQPELAERRVQKQSPEAKLASGFPQLLQGEPGLGPLFPLLLAQIHSQESRR